TEVRQEDHEDAPDRLAPAAEVAAAEDVREHRDQDPDPDEEQGEPNHGPEDLARSELCCDHVSLPSASRARCAVQTRLLGGWTECTRLSTSNRPLGGDSHRPSEGPHRAEL